MNVLCPTDFSRTSVDAIHYVAQFLTYLNNGRMEILHCINVRSRAGMFIRMDDILSDHAKKDMDLLLQDLHTTYPGLQIDPKVVLEEPKSFIPTYLRNHEFDFVFVGTKGLTSLKDMTVGSVTEILFRKSMTPVLAIPEGYQFTNIDRVVLGIDEDVSNQDMIFSVLEKLLVESNAELHVIYVDRHDQHADDKPVIQQTSDYRIQFREINAEEEISVVLNDYANKIEADMLCLVHKSRSWLGNFFHKSFVKTELFNLRIPILVLRD